jgi:undecaprenyl-diphosphatase
MSAVTLLGSTIVLIALSVCVILFFLKFRRQRAAVLFAITMTGAFVLNAVLKLSYQRARPDPYFDFPAPSSYSFPSGHALYAFCFYGTLAALVAAGRNGRLARLFVWAMAVLLIVMIGFSRVYLGVHYPSDVLAGYAAAFVWVCTIALGDHLLHRKGR